MSYSSTSVEPAGEYHGLRINHPELERATRRGIAMGWGNEAICKIVGVPPEFVDKQRQVVKALQSK